LIVFLDIGSTLIDASTGGPGSRIANELNLGADAVPALNEILFKTDAAQSGELAERVARRFGVGESETAAVIARIWDAQFDESYVLPGAVEAVEALRAAGISRAYVSNIWRPFYFRFEASFPAEVSTQRCFPSFRTHKMKPDVELLRGICSEIGVAARDVVMIGDTWEADMAPAMQIGAATIWILHRPHKEKADLVQILNKTSEAPDVTLANIGDLTAETVRGVHDMHLRRSS
jgi:FMN phosphatase YigB (HAD superfamily)